MQVKLVYKVNIPGRYKTIKFYLTMHGKQASKQSFHSTLPQASHPSRVSLCPLLAIQRMKTKTGLGLVQGFLCHLLDMAHFYLELLIRPEPVGCQSLPKSLMPKMEGLLAVLTLLLMTQTSGELHLTVTIRTFLISSNSHAVYCALGEEQKQQNGVPQKVLQELNACLPLGQRFQYLREAPSGNGLHSTKTSVRYFGTIENKQHLNPGLFPAC